MNFTQNYYRINSKKFTHGSGNIAYTRWGEVGKQTILCVHGLTRNSRDFDYLANNLADVYQIVCVDMVGRGKSDWLFDKNCYIYDEYIEDVLLLIDHLSCGAVDFIGTSMGGIVGMLIASRYPRIISRLVLNDIGSYTSGKALTNTRNFLRSSLSLPDNLNALKDFLCQMCPVLGITNSEHIEHFLRHSIVNDGGKYRMHEDPAIIRDFGADTDVMDDYDMWNIWNDIASPTLLIRGRTSHILSSKVGEQMLHRSDGWVDFVEFEAGHAPALMEQKQIQFIRQWLLNSE